MSRIIVVVRTRDEADNIIPFIQGYSWADKILVADGGSLDDTKELASQFPHVAVRDYPYRIAMENGLWRNPHGHHINWLIDWATKEEHADWIVMDDCDCWPNYLLRQDARYALETLEASGAEYIHTVRLYLWGKDLHYPHLAKPVEPHTDWSPSTWAWKASTGLRYVETIERALQEPDRKFPPDKTFYILPPHCLLHNFCPTPEKAEAKRTFYRESGQLMMEPYEKWCGPAEPLPAWAHP